MMVGNKEEDVSILTHPLLYYFSKNHIFGIFLAFPAIFCHQVIRGDFLPTFDNFYDIIERLFRTYLYICSREAANVLTLVSLGLSKNHSFITSTINYSTNKVVTQHKDKTFNF